MSIGFAMVYELSVPEPAGRKEERELFASLVEQVKIADEVGFHSVWHVEHHFLKGFSHSSASDVLLGAYSSVTKNIRIGYGVKLLPFAFNHPIRAAENAATLDLISGGRVDFGTGRGISRDELEGFGVDPRKSRQEWRESVDMIVKCWGDEKFSWDSESFKIPPRDVVPKPFQDPHPPLWLAATSPESHVIAGELGMGLLAFVVMVPLDEVARRLGLYREAIKEAKPVGHTVNEQAGIFTQIYCGESDEEAYETAGEPIAHHIKEGISSIASMAQWVSGSEIPAYEYLREMMKFDLDDVTFDHLHANDLVVVGSPETCIEKLKRYQDTGADLVFANFQAAGIPNEKVTKSIERFGREVLPEFK
jgi:alkanesulfonate monooxygenase SsuD/methylene tetrahydromethanopterin reductase-like flavin-dependent oxidoreductase (luciferase family)